MAVIIPAKDESRRIATTVRSARAIPGVDLVLVVDDGSEDSTQHVAREAGAVVVRHSHNRGKAAAMERMRARSSASRKSSSQCLPTAISTWPKAFSSPAIAVLKLILPMTSTQSPRGRSFGYCGAQAKTA